MIRTLGLVALLAFAAPDDAAPTAPPEQVATVAPDDLLRKRVWEGAFKSGAHVRYHQKLADKFGARDDWWRWSGIVLGVLSFAGPLIYSVSKRSRWSKVVETSWYALGTLALLLSIAGTFNQSATRANQHAILEQRWNALEYDWERLLRDRDRMTRAQLDAEVARLSTEERAIESAEPPGEAGPELLQAWHEEKTFRAPAQSSLPSRNAKG